MEEKIQKDIEETYNKCVEPILTIYEIFKDQFEEKNVDLQGLKEVPKAPESLKNIYINTTPTQRKTLIEKYVHLMVNNHYTIYIHWPFVKITNEYDKSIIIKDLWAKVIITYDGKLFNSFTLNRSNYSYLHINNNYMHSHISSIPFEDFTIFQKPCLGTGPITKTIQNLNNSYNKDLWELFCCELNNYVSVESVEGTPYHRLENLQFTKSINSIYTKINFLQGKYYKILNKQEWLEFIIYIIKSKKLLYTYHVGSFDIGVSYTKAQLIISDLFIEWYNKNSIKENHSKDLIIDKLLKKCVLKNGRLHGISDFYTNKFISCIGNKVLTFKGNDILLKVEDCNILDINFLYILKQDIINYIITIVLNIINYKYARNNKNNSSEGTVYI